MLINVITPPSAIVIGRRGEQNFREIQFNVKEWLDEFPDGHINIIYKRPDGQTYPVLVGATEEIVTWLPAAEDTAVPGFGKLEVRILDGFVIGKSATISTRIQDSLGDTGEAPQPPLPKWIDTVAQNAVDAEAAAERAEAASAHGIPEGGTVGQALTKSSNNDYAVCWADVQGGGGGSDEIWLPNIDSESNLSWSKSSTTSAPETVNIKGLQGERGLTAEPGKDGKDGADGIDGYTPVKGTDYWTAADIAEIKSYVDDAILGGGW